MATISSYPSDEEDDHLVKKTAVEEEEPGQLVASIVTPTTGVVDHIYHVTSEEQSEQGKEVSKFSFEEQQRKQQQQQQQQLPEREVDREAASRAMPLEPDTTNSSLTGSNNIMNHPKDDGNDNIIISKEVEQGKEVGILSFEEQQRKLQSEHVEKEQEEEEEIKEITTTTSITTATTTTNNGGGNDSAPQQQTTTTEGKKVMQIGTVDIQQEDDDAAEEGQKEKGSDEEEVEEEDDGMKRKPPSTPVELGIATAQTVVQTVVPQMERLPWDQFLLLSLVVAIPTVIYVYCFTALGQGEVWFYYLADNHGDTYANIVFGLSLGVFLFGYLFDANYWKNVVAQRIMAVLILVGAAITPLFLTGDYPYGPLCVYAAFVPLGLVVFNRLDIMTCCGNYGQRQRTRDFVSMLSGPLFAVSILTFFIWFIWTFLRERNEYNEVTIALFAQLTGCVPNLNDYPECRRYDTSTTTINGTNTTTAFDTKDVCFEILEEPHVRFQFPKFDNSTSQPIEDYCNTDCPGQVYDDCLNAFILWSGPLLVSMVLFFLSFFCSFLKGNDAERDMMNFGKLWLFLLFTMWLTASLAGVGGGLSSALISMTIASAVGSMVFVLTTRTMAESKTQAEELWERIRENYGDYLDVVRGLFLVCCTPFIIMYLILSVLNQAVRKLKFPCSKKLLTEEVQSDFVTKRTRCHINLFLSWNRTKILTYAIYWGIAYMLLQVLVSQFTVLFLSWLIDYTATLNLGVVTLIMAGVGMFLFMLPPVPGVPIYLTLGIVILATGRNTLGIFGGMCYAAGVSLILKLVACTVQQKVIGENLARYVSVRKLVGINSSVIKAMRLILAEKGFGIAKVCILVGGPDWPTSVLCGIMGLDLLPVLVGTLPVFFLILPTMLTGSFTYMAGLKVDDGKELEFPFADVLGTVMAAVTSGLMMASMISAAYYLEQTTTNRVDEINQIETDEEVAALELAEVAFNEAYTKVTEWDQVPLWAKLVLYVSFICLVISCYMIQFFGGRCFAEYELTYTIEEHLDGNWLNLVLPLGWVAILLFVFGSVLISGFVSWASSQARQELEANPPTSNEQAADVKEVVGEEGVDVVVNKEVAP